MCSCCLGKGRPAHQRAELTVVDHSLPDVPALCRTWVALPRLEQEGPMAGHVAGRLFLLYAPVEGSSST